MLAKKSSLLSVSASAERDKNVNFPDNKRSANTQTLQRAGH